MLNHAIKGENLHGATADLLTYRVLGQPPPDYKVHCFNGLPLFVGVVNNRFSDLTWTYYNVDRSPMDLKTWAGGKPGIHILPDQLTDKWDKMLEISQVLSNGIPFLRVDFFLDKTNRLYIGELTFTPSGGLKHFNPDEWDIRLGNLLKLPIYDSE